ncbi:hypothetical protein KQH61_05350 [bacterium]|nr:hypothetical protein [bacterium]MCB2179327.1 hypothetical protein [bacterium]
MNEKTGLKLGFGLAAALVVFLVFGAGTALAVQTGGFDCATQTAVSVDQCEALVAIYAATNGPEWDHQTGWLVEADVCQWYGVSCNAGSIIALDLYGNHLSGSLPLEIGGFPDLKTLTINDNALTGPIPLTITFLDLDLFHFHNTSLCEPADPSFQDWLSQIVYRLSSGISCSTPVPTATAAPFQTYTPQPTSNLPWPEQTLTALAQVATIEAAQAANASPTPTKYYTLKTATPQPVDTQPSEVQTATPTPQAQGGFLSGIPRGWLLLLLVPVALIIVGVLLEMRDRRKDQEKPQQEHMEYFDIEE